MSERQFKMVGLGEVLWDCLPVGKQLGGAPANFAYVSNQLGHEGVILSRIGEDEPGGEILEQLKAKGLATDFIQRDQKYRTGIVNVTLENGQPSYEIVEKVAWDFLEPDESWQALAKTCDAVCFGTLAQRNPVSQKTIQGLVGLTKGLRVFDVNLRQNYFTGKLLQESFQLADLVKLNDEELPVIAGIFKLGNSHIVDGLQQLVKEFNLSLICLTRGARGSLLVSKNEVSDHPGVKVKVADAIGAGDAFTAALTSGVLENWNLDEINQQANEIGALVASGQGAMPDFRGL